MFTRHRIKYFEFLFDVDLNKYQQFLDQIEKIGSQSNNQKDFVSFHSFETEDIFSFNYNEQKNQGTTEEQPENTKFQDQLMENQLDPRIFNDPENYHTDNILVMPAFQEFSQKIINLNDELTDEQQIYISTPYKDSFLNDEPLMTTLTKPIFIEVANGAGYQGVNQTKKFVGMVTVDVILGRLFETAEVPFDFLMSERGKDEEQTYSGNLPKDLQKCSDLDALLSHNGIRYPYRV